MASPWAQTVRCCALNRTCVYRHATAACRVVGTTSCADATSPTSVAAWRPYASHAAQASVFQRHRSHRVHRGDAVGRQFAHTDAVAGGDAGATDSSSSAAEAECVDDSAEPSPEALAEAMRLFARGDSDEFGGSDAECDERAVADDAASEAGLGMTFVPDADAELAAGESRGSEPRVEAGASGGDESGEALVGQVRS